MQELPVEPPTQSSDWDCQAERVKAGDVSAFEPLVRRFERPLRAWLAAHSQPGVDVDEIAQRTFVAVYTRITEYRSGTSFSAWLFTVARFQLQTEVTRLRRLTDYHSRYVPHLVQQSELNPPQSESWDLWETRLECLQACIQELSVGLRQYLIWRYEEQISIEQMAETTGRSTAAIKKQLWTLRQKLQRCIQERMDTHCEPS